MQRNRDDGDVIPPLCNLSLQRCGEDKATPPTLIEYNQKGNKEYKDGYVSVVRYVMSVPHQLEKENNYTNDETTWCAVIPDAIGIKLFAPETVVEPHRPPPAVTRDGDETYTYLLHRPGTGGRSPTEKELSAFAVSGGRGRQRAAGRLDMGRVRKRPAQDAVEPAL